MCISNWQKNICNCSPPGGGAVRVDAAGAGGAGLQPALAERVPHIVGAALAHRALRGRHVM